MGTGFGQADGFPHSPLDSQWARSLSKVGSGPIMGQWKRSSTMKKIDRRDYLIRMGAGALE